MRFFLIIGLFVLSMQAQAQYGFVATGDDAVTGFGSVTNSMGQLIIKLETNKFGSLIQGLQIPIEISKIPVGIDEIQDISAIAYPNPTFDHVKITIPEQYHGPFDVSIIDCHGAIIETHSVKSNDMVISLMHHSAGIYTMAIMKDSKRVSTFSIIKQ